MVDSTSLDACLLSHDSNTASSCSSHRHLLAGTHASCDANASCWKRNYEPDASIALVGIRGTGLSTLAVIAASFLGFKVLDTDHEFYRATGLSRAKYRSNHGVAQYRHAEKTLLRSMLADNPTKAIVVCGPGAVEPTGRASLSNFALDHPVIYVTRDIQGIQEHLRTWDTAMVSAILEASAPILRSVSNYEFHNATRVADRDIQQTSEHNSHDPLLLKQVEKDFLHFLHFATEYRGSERHGFSQLMLRDSRRFTFALVIPLPVSKTYWTDMRQEDILADAIELLLPLSAIGLERGGFDGQAADYITRQYCAAKSDIHLPIIINIQPMDHHAGSTSQAEDCYNSALHHCLRLGPDFLCVDLIRHQNVLRHLTAVKGRTKIIADYTESSASHTDWSSQVWSERVVLAEAVGADAVRLCQEATTVADNFAVRHFVDRMNASDEGRIAVIAYNTGSLGRMSRYCGALMNPVAEPSLQHRSPRSSYASLLTIRQSQSALYSSYILDTLHFGIYGNNVAQSLSPAMHNAAFERSGMPHVYKVFQHPTLNELEHILSDPRLGGLSVSAPFKSQVLSLVDEMSHEALMIGAVNTLIPLRSNPSAFSLEKEHSRASLALYGENTDWIGITSCIKDNLSPINAIKRKTTALVLGAGGMARAATYALARLGVRNMFIHNRTVERAEELVQHFVERKQLLVTRVAGAINLPRASDDKEISPTIRILAEKENTWPKDADYPTIVISCIATKDLNGQCSVDTSLPSVWLANPTGGVTLELSYAFLETPLLRQVRDLSNQGWIAVDGLQILPEQGKNQFELFTSRKAPIKVMREAVFKAYKQRINGVKEAAHAACA